MNEFESPFRIRSPRGLTAFLGVCAAAAGLSGCLAHPIADVSVDPKSPIAPYVAEAARYNTGYPKFSDIPAKPKDVRGPAAYRTQVQALETARADLEKKTAPNAWTLSGTEAFERQALKEAGPGLAAQPSAAETEAYARSLRERATQPPSPQN